MADPLALIHIDFQWAEDTLNLKMTYLLARLRIGIMCSAVIGTATGDVLTRDGIKAELELITCSYGLGSILGLSLPKPYFLQELLFSEGSKVDAIHCLFDDFSESEAHDTIQKFDPSDKFSWWKEGGLIPSKRNIDLIFREGFLELMESGLLPAAGKLCNSKYASTFLPPGIPFKCFHYKLSLTKQDSDTADGAAEKVAQSSDSVLEVCSILSFCAQHLEDAARESGPQGLCWEDPPPPSASCQVPQGLLFQALSNITSAKNVVEAALSRKLKAVSRSRWYMGAYSRLYKTAVSSGHLPFPSATKTMPGKLNHPPNKPPKILDENLEQRRNVQDRNDIDEARLQGGRKEDNQDIVMQDALVASELRASGSLEVKSNSNEGLLPSGLVPSDSGSLATTQLAPMLEDSNVVSVARDKEPSEVGLAVPNGKDSEALVANASNLAPVLEDLKEVSVSKDLWLSEAGSVTHSGMPIYLKEAVVPSQSGGSLDADDMQLKEIPTSGDITMSDTSSLFQVASDLQEGSEEGLETRSGMSQVDDKGSSSQSESWSSASTGSRWSSNNLPSSSPQESDSPSELDPDADYGSSSAGGSFVMKYRQVSLLNLI